MEVIETEYQWIVKNSEFNLTKNGQCIFSPTFSFKTNTKEYQWKILFAPRGDKKTNKDYGAIYLRSLNDFRVQVHFTVSISNYKTNKILRTQDSEYTFEPKTYAFGFPKMVNYDLLANEDIKIRCKINTQGDKPKIKATIDEMELKLSESQCRLKEFDKFGKLLDSGAFSDVIIKINEKEFKAHKCILASQSSVFKAMFSNELKENLENIVDILDIDSDVMEKVLYFMYTGTVTQTNHQMKMKIFIAADKYFIDGLKTLCSQQLSKDITVNNIIEIFNFAQIYDMQELHNDCIKFIGENTSALLKKPSGNSKYF